MSSRLPGRLSILRRYLFTAPFLRRRRKPEVVGRILVLHHLLLGDTLMLTPLLARLRERYPEAAIAMTVAPAFAPLYAAAPYGVTVLPFDPRNPATVDALLDSGPYDIAYLPGDNRYGLLAQAMGARWVVAFAGDPAGWKNAWCDELLPFPEQTTNVGDLFALLAGGDAWPGRFDPTRWPLPHAELPGDLPATSVAVLHLGAGNAMRLWSPLQWRALAEALTEKGLRVVWSAGRGEEALVRAADPQGRYPSVAGRLSLPVLAALLAKAQLLVCLDSGICHLAKHTGTPTVALYGPGNPDLFGRGDFWSAAPMTEVFQQDFPCRNEHVLFKRNAPWIVRCGRTVRTCERVLQEDGRPASACMSEITLAQVLAGVERVLAKKA